MSKTKVPYKRRFFKKSPDSPYEAIQISLPREVCELLRESSGEKLLPISRLIGYAIDNELECAVPFNYLCELPQTQYVKHAYAEEAGRIEKLLLKFPRGIGLDTLMLFRRSIGVPSKVTFMLGFRELIAEDRIEFATGARGAGAFQHAEDYEYVFLKDPPQRMSKRGSKRIEALADENLALKRELAKYQKGES